jgi:site-specific DNA-cytosine methylase
MRVLVACERSGKVREAFRKLGHDAWSNDIEAADDGSKFHIHEDCWQAIEQGWDLIIMHPPCTALCVSGNPTYAAGKVKQWERVESIEWTVSLWNHAKEHAPRVVMENPVGVLPKGRLPKPQYIQPYEHGHPESKKTGLWLHNVDRLTPTDDVKAIYDSLTTKERNRIHYMSPGPDRERKRSETYQGIANAFAAQWGTS